jgi:pectate lyase
VLLTAEPWLKHRCRYGYVHVLNNDYDGWQLYAIGGTSNPTIVSEGNRFRASDSAHREVTNSPIRGWHELQSRSDLC